MFRFRGLPGALAFAVLAAARAGATGQWTDIASPVSVPLSAVQYTNRTDAWAVGVNGTVARYQAGAWRNYPSGTDRDLKAVTVLGDGTAWAVGADGALVHYANGLWSPDAQSGTATLLTLRAVAFQNPDNGWAVGGDAGLGGVALRYVSGHWVTATATIDPLEGVAIIRSDNVWFCGWNRRLMKFDGTAFANDLSAPFPDGFVWRAVAFPFQQTGWVVGDHGSIATYRSGAWSPVSVGVTAATLFACSFLSQDGTGYAVGQNGVRLHGDGSSFSLETSGGEDLLGFDFVDALEGAAVGGVTGSRIVMLRALTTETGFGDLRIYPNPYDSNSGAVLTFDRLPNDVSAFALYTLKGERVADLDHGLAYSAATGVVTWNGRTVNAYSAAAGSYVYRLASRSGKSRQGVFLVQRR